MKQIKLNNHIIAKGKPPFIIAEVGINHNGDIKNALKMIDIAKSSAVNAIKFQTFKASELISDHNQKYTYKSQGKKVTESMLDMFKRYELDKEDWKKIKKRCDEKKILFLSTPQNKTDLDLLLNLKITAIKVGSDDLTNLPLIKEYSSTGLPLFLSCGMADLSEISTSLNTIGSFDGYPTVLLHTTSQYPTPEKDVNLLKLKTLQNTFPNIPVGFSDHTQGPLASSLAVALGAVIFEKHFNKRKTFYRKQKFKILEATMEQYKNNEWNTIFDPTLKKKLKSMKNGPKKKKNLKIDTKYKIKSKYDTKSKDSLLSGVCLISDDDE